MSEKEHEIASTFMGFTEKEKKKDYVNLLLQLFCGWSCNKNLSEFYEVIQRKGEQLYLGQEQMCRWSARTHKLYVVKGFSLLILSKEAKFSSQSPITEDMATTDTIHNVTFISIVYFINKFIYSSVTFSFPNTDR